MICSLITLGMLAGFTGGRILLLTTAAGIGALYLPRLLPSRIFKILVIALFFLPYGLIIWSVENEASVFEVGLSQVEDQSLKVDTRTFLYQELLEDLQKNDALWFGKGALSGYQSKYFGTNGTTIGRTSSEVYFLHLLMRGGLIYLILIQLLLFLSIRMALKNGCSQLCKSFAFSIACFSCLAFIGDFLGANILHVSIWVMVGFCLSNYWTSLSDQELIKMIYKNR